MNKDLLTPVQSADVNPSLIFRDGQCLLQMTSLAGTRTERFISWESVREVATGIPVDSGWLSSEIVRWGTGRHGDWVVVFVPPGRHELELTEGVPGPDEKFIRVTAPLPGIVIFAVSNKYFVWAQKGERFGPHHELYRCPLPNVMQDASICWGPIKPPLAAPRTVLKGWELFIRSTFNNHAANGKSKRKREDVRELLKDLALVHGQFDAEANAWGEPWYPVEDLVRQVEGGGASLDNLIRQFWETGVMPG